MSHFSRQGDSNIQCQFRLPTATSVPKLSKGHVALVGDAGHSILPHLPEGGAAAIEDALALAESLSTSETISKALENFSQQRKGKVNQLEKEAKGLCVSLQTERGRIRSFVNHLKSGFSLRETNLLHQASKSLRP